MNGVLVAKVGQSSVYFIVDENIDKDETGAIIGPDEIIYSVPFWDWVNSKHDLTELKGSEFLQLLWGEPSAKDEKLWLDIFVNGAVPITQDILGDTPIMPLQGKNVKQKPKEILKKQRDTIDIQTKISKLILSMGE